MRHPKSNAACCRAAVTLVETLQLHSTAVAASLKAPSTAGSADVDALDPDTVVDVTAALDGCYYALLEHSLTCGWVSSWSPAAAPLVPGHGRSPPR